MAMTRGVTEVVTRLHAEGRLDGIAGVGGSGGSSMIAPALQALPIGVPKLLVSTMASGDARPYVGTSSVLYKRLGGKKPNASAASFGVTKICHLLEDWVLLLKGPPAIHNYVLTGYIG